MRLLKIVVALVLLVALMAMMFLAIGGSIRIPL